MIRIHIILFALLATVNYVLGQNTPAQIDFNKRMRVIIDNDFSGDADGLFQLSHLLLSPEYPDMAFPPPNASKIEYNLNIDIAAARMVFNQSAVALWQVPRDAYRQAIIPYSLLLMNIKPKGNIGNYLYQELLQLMKKLGGMGETYILGDSPLVLLTALQTYFEPDAASSSYQKKPAPKINKNGQYEDNRAGRAIRVYDKLDVNLMLNDFFAKLELFNQQKTQH